ncbi:MAG: Ger(x)C family spore germination protein [Firmicutes bacterium]|nr:Ger(x)C family spore germination protein [Bacillota bacterium]
MKKKLLKYIIFTILLFLLLLLTACWDRKELDDLAVVAGIAIDYDQETEGIKLTAQIIKAGEVGQPQGGGNRGSSAKEEGAETVWVVESTGETVFDAVRNFTFQSSRKLYFPHNNIIVFSKELAEKGITPYLSFFIRDHETRNMVWVLIAEDQAGDVMRVKTDLEEIPAVGIAGMIEDRVATSEISGIMLHEFLTMLMSKTTGPVATPLRILEKDGEKKPLIAGTAVFKGDKLLTYLNIKETRGLLWVKGEVESGIIVIKDLRDNKISIEITKASSKVKAEITDGEYKIKLKVFTEGNIGEQMGDSNLATGKMIAYLERQKQEAVKKEIEAVLKKAKDYKTDIFAFGEAFHRKYPDKWQEIERDWDDIFPEIKVSIEVDSQLHHAGLNVKPPIPVKQ